MRLWAKCGIAVGCLLATSAGFAGPVNTLGGLSATALGGLPAAAAQLRAGVIGALTEPIRGPLNILLIGIDPRDDHTAPLSDSMVVAHIPADRSGAYLFSLPRDLVVPIPAFAKSGSPAQRAKLNAAMALGSRIGEHRYSPAQGFELLTETIRNVTGIRFDAGAILNFGGFTTLVAAMGGVSVPVDETVVSEHRKPDGTSRDRLPQCPGHDDCHRPYIGVQKVYPKSDKPVHFQGWEALDYCRQRYGLPHSDYDRQRHQRQFVQALAKKMKRRILTDPAALPRLTATVGSSLTFIGNGHPIADWAAALGSLRTRDMTGIGLPGYPLFENGAYQGEQLPPTVTPFFAAVQRDRIAAFLRTHPGLVSLDARL
ncbi:transcriptional regulator [Actinoplanes sp. SE50]|uniref:LCP family protein n=1 Tax=unclassified Actinoplanes TaxID=2626549 RepID=UPI00023ED0CD|nr:MULTISPECIES: LCP family protein [unclassified Actinoplanes]AEV86083.1 Membrane-bound protein lytR [Actinoplanes sp. SE50/110]ATO84481.1 transcriptional regulator [Actinoplanes sp. SE50]SLM01891.1 transcriptional regulator [Actinoplanes sp. SE50/110]